MGADCARIICGTCADEVRDPPVFAATIAADSLSKTSDKAFGLNLSERAAIAFKALLQDSVLSHSSAKAASLLLCTTLATASL
jgi:hypothetical protein